MARVGATKVHSGTNKRNLLINGGFDFSQRSSAFVPMTFLSYQTADRWQVGHFTGDKLTQLSGVQGSGGPPLGITNEVTNNLAFQSTHTGPLGDLECRQFIERKNTSRLAGNKASFSGWFQSDSAARLRIVFSKATVNNTFAGGIDFLTFSNSSFDNSNTWTEVKIENIDIPADAEHGIYITVFFEDFQNITGTRNHRMSALMFNEGETVAPFVRAGIDIGRESGLCQRYFRKTWAATAAVGSSGFSGSFRSRKQSETSSLFFGFTLGGESPMRIAPTGICYSPSTGIAGNAHGDTTGEIGSCTIAADTSGTGNMQGPSGLSLDQLISFHVTLDSEIS